jgi:hypothetical protein
LAECGDLRPSANARAVAASAGLTAQRFNPVIKAFCDTLLKRGKPKMTVVGAAMRKLLHLAYGVVKSGKAFDPNYLKSKPIGA